MQTGKTSFAVMLLAAALFSSAVVLAHHSYAMFDRDRSVTLTGTVNEFQWVNPHVFIEIDVQSDEDGVQRWSIECESPNALQRRGWKSKDLKSGDKVTVIINPLRDGRHGGMLMRVTMPDGRPLDNQTLNNQSFPNRLSDQ